MDNPSLSAPEFRCLSSSVPSGLALSNSNLPLPDSLCNAYVTNKAVKGFLCGYHACQPSLIYVPWYRDFALDPDKYDKLMLKGWPVPKVTEGDMAPDFTLPTNGEGTFCLSDNLGSELVLFFYPKDDTSGCTKEAIDFSSLLPEFSKLGVGVYGMSPDPVKKHDKFIVKHELTVPLISDEEKTILDAYGVWVEKSMYGRKYMGVERTTLLIDAQGKVARAWHKVKVPDHAQAVLDATRELAG